MGIKLKKPKIKIKKPKVLKDVAKVAEKTVTDVARGVGTIAEDIGGGVIEGTERAVEGTAQAVEDIVKATTPTVIKDVATDIGTKVKKEVAKGVDIVAKEGMRVLEDITGTDFDDPLGEASKASTLLTGTDLVDEVLSIGKSTPKIDPTYAGQAFTERGARGLITEDDNKVSLEGLKIKRKDKKTKTKQIGTGR